MVGMGKLEIWFELWNVGNGGNDSITLLCSNSICMLGGQPVLAGKTLIHCLNPKEEDTSLRKNTHVGEVVRLLEVDMTSLAAVQV